MKEEVLKFLGRGSCFNVKEENTAAYIKDPTGNGDLLLIDCGGTVFHKIVELNILNGVKRIYILITHNHADHIGSLADLIFYCNYVCNIEVHLFIFRRYYSTYDILLYQGITHDMYTLFNKKSLDEDPYKSFFKIKDFILEDHTTESIGFCIEIPSIQQSFYYSGDTKSPIALDFVDTDNTDFYYYDCALRVNNYPHVNLYSLISAFKEHNILLEKLRLMHIDCDGVLFEADQMGIKCVEVEEC